MPLCNVIHYYLIMNKGLPPTCALLHPWAVSNPFEVVNITRLFFESNFHNCAAEYCILRLGLYINFIEFITGSPFLYFKKTFNKLESIVSIL